MNGSWEALVVHVSLSDVPPGRACRACWPWLPVGHRYQRTVNNGSGFSLVTTNLNARTHNSFKSAHGHAGSTWSPGPAGLLELWR